jgi:predicted NBD/HSP70 family sugar kinase
LTDFSGQLVAQDVLDLHHDETPQQVFTAARQRVEKLLKHARAKMSDVHGVGVGLRGHPSPEGLVRHSVAANWRDVPLREIAAKIFGLPVFISRGEYRAVAEYRHAPGAPPAACMLLFNVADGVSARPVLNGNLYGGGSGLTGEIGHVVVQPNGPLCTCGRRGCLEAVISGPAICRRIVAESETLHDVSPGLYDALVRHATEGNAAAAVTELVRLAEDDRAEYARQLLDHVIALAAQGLAMSVACFGPDRIVVDGYVFRDRPDLLKRLENATKSLLGLGAQAMCPLESSSLGESARVMALGLLVADALVREGKVAG